MEEINIPCKFQRNVFLRDKTWIHRGGNVDFWLQPETTEELEAVGKLLYSKNEPFITIGHTSNTYFKNSFNIKYVIDTRHLTQFSVLDKSTLVCDCGAAMAKVSRYCVENGIEGYEGMIGLPGTVGGAIFCNSGCYGSSIEKTLKYIDLLTEHGEVIRIFSNELGFAFRDSSMKRGELKGIILRAYFDISHLKDKNLLKSISEKNQANRKETQDPPAQNLGSTVNVTGLKKSFRNFIISQIVRVYAHITSDKQRSYILRKNLTCLLFGCNRISQYISDKRMNCFIWKDSGADEAYTKYLILMDRVWDNCSIEIITKE